MNKVAMAEIAPAFWNCCEAKPTKIVAFDDDRDGASKGALIWHYACEGCASTVHASRVQDAPIKLWTREHEVMIEVVRPNVGICRDCDEPVSLGRFAWDHRISTGPSYQGEWRLGEDSFTKTRHTSGKEPCDKIWSEDRPKAQCPLCGAYESFKTVQHAYSDETTCMTDGCTYRSEYQIGD